MIERNEENGLRFTNEVRQRGIVTLKLGSLFDGSGTAPLAAALCGIEPVWASEIDAYPISVTKARFPKMLHLGDIRKINGASIPPVDIICGGSPCQGLSVAGRMAGLHDDERSQLFFEMIRVIREMRGATNGIYPRYIIFENVTGLFSSNKGKDFLALLRAFAELADPAAYVPEPEAKAGRLVWKRSGELVADGWSLCWRTVDSRLWGRTIRDRDNGSVLYLGTPQRRRRVYLVVDLRGERSSEILFKPEGMSRNSCESREETYNSSRPVQERAARGNSVIAVYDARGNGDGRIVPTITGDHNRRVTDYTAICVGNGQLKNISMSPVANTLDCMHDQQAILISDNLRRRYFLRRLTPLECCRLQGFPDWWTEGCEVYPVKPQWIHTGMLNFISPTGKVEGSDTAKYRMWGNGMALPNVLHIMRGISDSV